MASDAGRRLLEFHLDTNRADYETLFEAVGASVLDALLPGRGVVTLKYDADFRPIAEPRPPDEDTETEVTEEPAEYASKEQICPESIIWDRVYFGYAKKWQQVPWIAYEYFLTKEEVASRFGKPVATKLSYATAQASPDEDGAKREHQNDETYGVRKTACVYQIWDKVGGKRVIHMAPSYTEGLLKEEDDPLGLTGFFNTPRPLCFVDKSWSQVPTSPYKMYKNQAQELNRITQRINKLVNAIKARGVYDGALGDQLGKLMEKDDATLIPTEVASSLATEKGFANAIWFLPIDVLIAVLVQLYQARESCKQVIYEITGISDIIRGSTQASETATAQQIKSQWGTLRLKRMQSEVARYVRDLLRMTLELAATKFSEETWGEMTGLPFVTSTQRQQLEMQAQMIVGQGQPLPPKLQQQLAQPVWSQILDVLRNDATRTYRIDVETNSTVEPEAAEDQKHINELLGMLGQLLNGLGPLVAKGVMPFQAVQGFLLFVVRRFRMGSEIEDYIKAMQPPKPEDDGKGAEAQAKAQEQQMQMQKQMAIGEVQMKQQQSEMTLKQQTMEAEKKLLEKKIDLELREIQLKAEQDKFTVAQQAAQQQMQMKEQVNTVKAGADEQIRQVKTQGAQREQQVAKSMTSEVKQATQQVAQLSLALQSVQDQAKATQELLQQLLTVAKAPRVKKAVRGRDGRIERVEEEILT
jgi:hypothetical protein